MNIIDPDKFGVVNTFNQSWNVLHDAAHPFAVVEFNGRHGTIRRTISRHVSMDDAKVARLAYLRKLKAGAEIPGLTELIMDIIGWRP